jgi:hypothetical protein
LLFDPTPENIRAAVAAEAAFDMPDCVTLHHFVMKTKARMLAIFFSWSDPDHEKGRAFLKSFLDVLPPVRVNTVSPKSPIEHHQQFPLKSLPWGGQRSIYIQSLSPGVLEILIEALATMPPDLNIGWSQEVAINHDTCPSNCFGIGNHMFLSFSDIVPEQHLIQEARAWNDGLYTKLRQSGDSAILEGSYPPLTRPDDRTPAQLFGDKWERVKELKNKYDPDNVFRHGAPEIAL